MFVLKSTHAAALAAKDKLIGELYADVHEALSEAEQERLNCQGADAVATRYHTALVAIIAMDTPNGNATVKRAVARAREALTGERGPTSVRPAAEALPALN
jgi:hypothetical protein